MLKKGAIQEVSLSDQAFYSRLYLVPKKEGTYRPVIDLSSLNRFVPHFHFQTEGLHCLKTVLRKGDPMTSIDLKDAYFSVAPLHLRALQILLIQTLRHHQFDYNCPVFLNPQSRAEPTWWLNNLGQRQPCFSPTTESHNSLRCFNARLACHVSGQVHKRQMVQSGINPAHQPPGIKSSISCPQNIPQGPVSQGCSIEVGQLHGSSLSQQQRRHPLSSSDVLNSGNLDMVSSKKHLNFSTACSWKRKYCSRLRVSYLARLNRLATRSNGNHTLPYKLEHGSFRQPLNSTATPILKGLRVSMVPLESLVC